MMKKVVFGIFILLGVGLFLFYLFQEKLIFLNGKKTPKDYTYQFPQTFEEVNLSTQDNQTIHALHFKLEKPKGVILFFHGNKGNLERWGTIVPYLLEYEYEVLVMDYRNYGKSTGNFNEEQMYADALLTYDYLKQHYSEDQIVVYGRSMGATFATRVGAENNPKHVVLEAPFYNLKRATQYYFSLSPTFLLKYQFYTNKDIPKVTSPITFFHGDDDATTSFDQSKELFQLVTSQQKEFVPIQTVTHHNLKEFAIYQETLNVIFK
jgi:alpha-beta hydrolase superfamily lysophospholipase